MKTPETPHYSILITDDDPSSREVLRDIVEPEGYAATLATSGEEALEIVRAQPVHLLLVDMHMPRLTGLETVQLLRQTNDLLPAILITADSSEGLMRQAFQLHIFSVLPKPVNKSMVLYSVVRALVRAYGNPPTHSSLGVRKSS